MSDFRSSTLLLFSVLIFPTVAAAQNGLAEPRAPITPKYVVSVQQLKMSSKAKKAFDTAAKLLQKGDAAESLNYFNLELAEYPQDYLAYYNMGLAHYRLGHASEAEQAFQKSIDLTGGGYAPPQFGMGMVLCSEGDLPRAETLLQRALELEPGSAMGKYFLGWAQFGLNRLVEAERSVQQALVRKANFADAYFLLARIHLRQHNSPAVVQDLEAYLKLDAHSAGSQQARALLQSTRQTMNLRVDWTLVGTLVP
jgi:tetratricopeptide (TPR) repeat protein